MARGQPQDMPTFGLALIRIVTGLVLFSSGWRWLSESTLDGSVIETSVTPSLGELSAPLAWWGDTFLLYNPDAIAFLWRWGALWLGLLFIVGALTRPAGALAALFLSHALCYGPREYELSFLLLLVSSLAISSARAGRRLGLDAVFEQQLPSWMTWTRRSGSIFP